MKSQERSEEHGRTSRRNFARTFAAALVAAPLATSLVQAQTPDKPKEAPAPPAPQPSQTPQQPSPTAEAYRTVARARFGEHVKPEQWEQIMKDLEGNVRTADRLRSIKLKNADEPDFIFSAG
jgi:hypothetical protein